MTSSHCETPENNSETEEQRNTQLILSTIKFIVSILAAYGLYLQYTYSMDLRNVPIPQERWPSLLAPAITVFVAFMAFGRHIIDVMFIRKIRQVTLSNLLPWFSISCGIFVWFFCYKLASQENWHDHLLWMGALFVIFLLWDYAVLNCTKTTDCYFVAKLTHVKIGNILINWPSIVAIMVLGFALSTDFIFPADWKISSTLSNNLRMPPSKPELSAKDVFVSGVISFHLFVASIGYFIGAITNDLDGTVAGGRCHGRNGVKGLIRRFFLEG